MNVKHLIVSILLILSLATFLRIYNLNALPIFADEAIYVRWSQVMRAEPSLRFLPLSDGKQPLFMWATIPLLKIVSDPLLAGRLLSAAFGLGTTLAVGTVSYLLFKNSRQAILSALFWAILPYSVFFERLALVDSMLAFFFLAYFGFMFLTIRSLRLDMSMLAGFAAGFAALTKSPAVFALALSPVLFVALPRINLKSATVACLLWLATAGIALGMYNVLRLGPQFHMIAQRNQDYVLPLSQVLAHPLDPLVPHLKDVLQFFLFLATPFGLFLAVWGLFDGHRAHLRQRLILAVFLLVPIVSQAFVAKGFTARYLFFTLPFATLLMTHALEHLGQRTQKHFLVIAGSALVVVSSLWIDYKLLTRPESAPLPRIERAGYLEEWTAGYGLKEVSLAIRQAAVSGPVVVGSEGFFGTPHDALALYLNDLPNVRVIGVGVWIDSVHQKLINALVDNQVFLVVNSSRFHADPQNTPGLKLISNYPKAVRPDGTREHLLFFQVLPQ